MLLEDEELEEEILALIKKDKMHADKRDLHSDRRNSYCMSHLMMST